MSTKTRKRKQTSKQTKKEIAFNKVQDSGERRKFKSGAHRDMSSGKGRFDLLSPISLTRLARHFENGAVKYGDRNWEKGLPMSSFFDSAVRHMYKYLEGHKDEDHLAAAMWNVHCLIHTEEMINRGIFSKELNDMPQYLEVKDENR